MVNVSVVRPRLGISAASTTALAIVVTGIVSAMIWYSLWSPALSPPKAGEQAQVTYRIPSLGFYEDYRERPVHRIQPLQVDIGEKVSPKVAELLHANGIGRRPPTLAYLLGMFSFILMVLLVSFHGFRIWSPQGKLLRPHILTSATVVLLLAGSMLFLYLTPLPALWLPLPLVAYVFASSVDSSCGLFAGLACVLTVAFSNHHDPVMASTMSAQVVFLSFMAHSGRKGFFYSILLWLWVALVGAVVYTSYRFITMGKLPAGDTENIMNSHLTAIAGSCLLMGFISSPGVILFNRLLAVVPRNKLQKLADFSNPLLQRVAIKSPGTWQHSLAMANMAEQVANAIRADALLSRVGALYHDIGKSKQPEYFAENITEQTSPHEKLSPETSADAIIAHVTEGVRMAREAGLPERIIDFIHMHHGDTVLEYFWHKNMENGNREGFTRDDFRYPGISPRTKETGILAIVDSLEAASRSLSTPTPLTLKDLVRRIIFEKIQKRQLDESGITMKDLTIIAETLAQMLQSQFHIRPEYPWQKQDQQISSKTPIKATQIDNNHSISEEENKEKMDVPVAVVEELETDDEVEADTIDDSQTFIKAEERSNTNSEGGEDGEDGENGEDEVVLLSPKEE